MKKIIGILVIIVVAQAAYIVLQLNKKQNVVSTSSPEQKIGKDFLIEKMKEMGVNVKAVEEDDKLVGLLRIDLEGQPSFFATPDGKYHIVGDLFDVEAKKIITPNRRVPVKEQSSSAKIDFQFSPENIMTKEELLKHIDSQIEGLRTSREQLLKNGN